MTALWKGFLGLSLLWQIVIGCVAVVAAVNALVAVSGVIMLGVYGVLRAFQAVLNGSAAIVRSCSVRSWRIPRFWRRSATAPAS
jgi:hypothetical protein